MPRDSVDDILDRLVRAHGFGDDWIIISAVQASRMFNAMLDDILMDVALQSHQEVARSKAVCDVCHTRYVRQSPSSAMR